MRRRRAGVALFLWLMLLDTTFDGDGKRMIDFGGFGLANALGLQPDGRIVVAGDPSGDLAIARLQGDSGSATSGRGGSGGPGTGSGVPRCAGRRATIVGTAIRDRLRGTRRADVIASLSSNDEVLGGRGNELICAGSGNDRLFGQRGKDRLFGGAGRDRLLGGPGKDRCLERPGRDHAACERARS